MNSHKNLLRSKSKCLVALCLIGVTYVPARQPRLSATERAELGRGLCFERLELPEPRTLFGDEFRTVREVHPDVRHIASWISAVGGAVAVCDLDGDGLENDVAYVDTRSDRILVVPAPETGERFEPFTLDCPFESSVPFAPMGVLPGDFDEDGRVDLMAYYWGRTPVFFLRTEESVARGSFRAQALESREDRWYTNAATRADVDGDGHPDLVFGNYFPDGSRLLDPRGGGSEHMQHSMSRARNGGLNRICLWKAAEAGESVSFAEAVGALDEFAPTSWTLAVGACDLDGDMLPELYFANDFGTDFLLLNESVPGEPRFRALEGRTGFATPSSKVLGRDSFKGMGVDFGDVNGDGVFDLYVSNITDEYALLESQLLFVSTPEAQEEHWRFAPYRDASEELGVARSGWCWDARLADLDNDGVLEALQATGFVKGTTNRWPELQEAATGNDELLPVAATWPCFLPGDDLCGHQTNPLFVRDADGRFWDVAADVGFSSTAVTRGLALADVDGDLDLDVLSGNQWETSTLHRNDSATGNALFLRLLLPLEETQTSVARGRTPAARHAIGAVVRATLADGRTLVAQVDGGNGHSGKRGKEVHFGLGERGDPVRLDVRYRDPRGRVRNAEFTLEPGRHTLVLGWKGDAR